MSLRALGYIAITSDHTAAWEAFATRLLGFQQVDRGGRERLFRMDDRKQRLILSGGSDEGLACMGWEVGSATDLEAMAARLDRAGVALRLGSRALCDQRHVSGLIQMQDPEGNPLEIFYGPELATQPFVPARALSGFKTGALGMGHAVLHVQDMARLLPFYRDLLGFQVTDYGLTPYPLYFFHLNARHHSFAMVQSGRRGLHHFMVELLSLDDVGQGYDLAQQEEGRVAYSLGRHSNDHMMSFYAQSPSGFFVEYGWGAREIDPPSWQAHETHDGPSYWGHERLHLPEGSEARQALRQMRLDASARGLRAPDPQPNCAWLQGLSRREVGGDILGGGA